MSKVKREFKGVWIVKEIWLNEDLTWMEKLFIAEINSLDGDKGCYASNNYFGDFFGLSPARCSQIINSLIKKNYVSAEYKKKGKQITKRVLRILNTPIKNSKEGVLRKLNRGIKNTKPNNTSVNNINKNNTSTKLNKLIDLNINNKKINEIIANYTP